MRIIAILSTALLCACDAQSTQQFAGALVGALGQQYDRNRNYSDGYRAPAPYYPQYPQQGDARALPPSQATPGVDATGYVEAPSDPIGAKPPIMGSDPDCYAFSKGVPGKPTDGTARAGVCPPY